MNNIACTAYNLTPQQQQYITYYTLKKRNRARIDSFHITKLKVNVLLPGAPECTHLTKPNIRELAAIDIKSFILPLILDKRNEAGSCG